MKRTALWGVALCLSAAVPASAFMWGNPGKVLEQGRMSFGGVLDLGERNLEGNNGGSADATVNGLYLDWRGGMGNGLEVYGRLIPLTQRWDFENSSYDPRIFGLGGGVKWVPPGQSGPLTWGLGAGLDWGTGDDSGRDLDYLELGLNGGVGYAVDDRLDVYGGLSIIESDINVETGAGGDADIEFDRPVGLFGGVAFKASPDWTLGAELRLVNETVLGLSARYGFGGTPARRSGSKKK